MESGRAGARRRAGLGRRPLPLMAASGVALAHALGGTAGDADAAYAVAATLNAASRTRSWRARRVRRRRPRRRAVQLGRLREAEHAERLLAVARASGRGASRVLFWAGLMRCLLGRLADAAEIFDEAIEIARLAGNASSVGSTLFGRSLVATMAGDVELALSCGEESAEVLAPLDDALPTMWSALVLASARLSADDATGAIDARRAVGAAGRGARRGGARGRRERGGRRLARRRAAAARTGSRRGSRARHPERWAGVPGAVRLAAPTHSASSASALSPASRRRSSRRCVCAAALGGAAQCSRSARVRPPPARRRRDTARSAGSGAPSAGRCSSRTRSGRRRPAATARARPRTAASRCAARTGRPPRRTRARADRRARPGPENPRTNRKVTETREAA